MLARVIFITALMGVVRCSFAAFGETPGKPALSQGPVDFERHVAPLFSKYGCNAGSCHGSSEGQGMFKLSLFGSDIGADYAAITSEDSGLIDTAEPELSLLLKKPAQLEEHGGGARFQADSVAWQTIRSWIAAGAEYRPGSGSLKSLHCQPNEMLLPEDAKPAAFKVIATFDDGAQEDVTEFCEYRIQDELVAGLDDGAIHRAGPGDTHLLAVYRGHPVSLRILAPNRSGAIADPQLYQTNNRIDEFVNAKLNRLQIEPSPASSDAEFLRRATLITIGQLPTTGEVRAFVADTEPDKRERVIEHLLNHPLHASLWATRMCEITGSHDLGSARARETDREREWQWHEWFRTRFAQNVPYDAIVRDIFSATTRDGRSFDELVEAISQRESAGDDFQTSARHYSQRKTLDLFWQRPKLNEDIDVEELTERVSAAFLGVRIECARCHKHPFDRWTQNDHRSLTNVFTQIRFGLSPASRAAMVDLLDAQREDRRKGLPTKPVPAFKEVFVNSMPHDRSSATSDRKLPPRALGGPLLPSEGDRRLAFAEWMTSPENPMFARNFVNRVWQWYFSRGLVEPVDAFSAANPPSHPHLLDFLARDFAENGFDVRRLERQILTSHTWQRSSQPKPSNVNDQWNFARFYVRRLRTEAVIDGIRSVTGSPFAAADSIEAGLPAAAIPVALTGEPQIDTWFRVFQRPERKLTCDCEQRLEPTLRQSMFLLSDSELLSRVRNGDLGQLLEQFSSDEQLVKELFLRALARQPDDSELKAALVAFRKQEDRRSAAVNVLWSLINTREFLTIH
jgi:hypothetical protein